MNGPGAREFRRNIHDPMHKVICEWDHPDHHSSLGRSANVFSHIQSQNHSNGVKRLAEICLEKDLAWLEKNLMFEQKAHGLDCSTG